MKMLFLMTLLFLNNTLWAGEIDVSNLPPDPGEAGKATLAGIDSDNDGVRDDVQRWIAMTYPNSAKTRAALTQMAKAKQMILMNAENATKARAYALEENRASICISYVRKQVLGTIVTDDYDIETEMKARYLNTYLRTKTYLQYDSHLGGMTFTLPDDYSTGCNFNPNAMPN